MAESRACTREGMWAFISSQLELLKVIERGEIKESATKPNAKTYFARKVLERLNDKEIWVQREVKRHAEVFNRSPAEFVSTVDLAPHAILLNSIAQTHLATKSPLQKNAKEITDLIFEPLLQRTEKWANEWSKQDNGWEEAFRRESGAMDSVMNGLRCAGNFVEGTLNCLKWSKRSICAAAVVGTFFGAKYVINNLLPAVVDAATESSKYTP